MKARILLYKSAWGDGHLLDNAIGSWTWLWNQKLLRRLTPEQRAMIKAYSHIELWLPDENGLFIAADYHYSITSHYAGTCYTSTMRYANGKDGTVKRPASEVLKNPGRLDYIEIDLEDEYMPLQIDYMDQSVAENKGYDKLAILSFFWIKRFHNALQYICSERIQDYILYFAARWALKFRYANLCRRNGRLVVPSPLSMAILMVMAGLTIKPLIESEG